MMDDIALEEEYSAAISSHIAAIMYGLPIMFENIEDEHDIAEDECIQKRAAGAFSVQALTTIEEFNQFFGTKIETENTETMGGFLSSELGHVPVVGEEIETNGIYFRVLKATDRRAELFEAKPAELIEAEAEAENELNNNSESTKP
mgnify:CR=1 FL=1